jgi:hypothetical protein
MAGIQALPVSFSNNSRYFESHRRGEAKASAALKIEARPAAKEAAPVTMDRRS